MKKLSKFTIVALISLLVLTGCASANTQVTGSDEIYATIKGNELTKGDIYNFIKLKYGVAVSTTKVIDFQLDQYVEMTEEDLKEANETLAEIKESFKDNFEMAMLASGYKTEEEYLNNYIIKNMKQDKLLKLYFEENSESLIKELHTRKVRTIQTTTKAEAEEVIEKAKAIEDLNGDKFFELAKEYNKDEDKVMGEAKIENVYKGREDETFYNTQLVDSEVGIIDTPVIVDGGFAVIYIDELDVEADMDEILKSYGANEKISQIVKKTMYSHYNKIGKFEIHDAELAQQFKENDPFTPDN